MVKSLKHDVLLQVGGSGRKYISVVKEESDYFIYVGQGTKKWDSCAGEALIKAIGGVCSGIYGKIYQYPNDSNEKQLLNDEGILCASDPELYYELLQQCSQFDI